MVIQFSSGDIFGIEGRVVDVEVDLIRGLQNFVISGVAGPRVKESRERIRSAIVNSGFDYPGTSRIVVNLAPAELAKDGCFFDLAIALGILASEGQVAAANGRRWGVLGELSLDGMVRPIRGTLGMVAALRRMGIEQVMLPHENLGEGLAIEGVRSIGVRTLREAAALLAGKPDAGVREAPAAAHGGSGAGAEPDFAEVIGHASIKRALALAVAGEHNVLLVGPPGAGKSFLARRLGSLLPPLTRDEQLEVTQIHSAAGLLAGAQLIARRPFRAPHHTISWAGLVGGCLIPRPGEVTLAHRGVLFLDEMPEFPRRSLEALREPLEEGRILISRAHASMVFPARLLLVAAMNPCPCGHHRSPRRICRCTPEKVRGYLQHISGPLLDRIDLRLEVGSPPGERLLSAPRERIISSADLRGLVERAVAFRRARGRERPNRCLEWSERERWAPLGRPARELLAKTAEELDMSTRGATRVLRLARTIADAAERDTIEERHLLESLELYAPRGGQDYLGLLQSM